MRPHLCYLDLASTHYTSSYVQVINDNSVALVRERTIPTERQPFVGELIANFFRQRGVDEVSAADLLRP
jgi:hypothetical protein